jgi:hypothetical protein
MPHPLCCAFFSKANDFEDADAADGSSRVGGHTILHRRLKVGTGLQGA